MDHMTMLIFVTKFFIYSLTTTTTTTIHTTITTTLIMINTGRNSSGRNGSDSTMAGTTGDGTRGATRLESQVHFLFFFFCTILMFVLPRLTRNRKKGPRDVTNVSWGVFNFTMPANADHGARDKSQAPSSVSFFFFLRLFIALISI